MGPLKVGVCFVALTVLLIGWAYILKSIWTRPSRLRSASMKFSLTLATLGFLFLILEVVFFTGFAASDGFDFTLASRRWFAAHWGPINSLGYRDVEHTAADFRGKRVLFVVGDSFVAGHGIANTANRFSDILKKNLGAEYEVVNVAQNGWNTADEFQAIARYPQPPQKIILSYYVDDIHSVAQQAGFMSPWIVEPPRNASLRYAVGHSYFLNFAYWRFYRFHNRDFAERYWQQVKSAYDNAGVWQAQETELQRIIDYARSHHVELIVVVFPNLSAIDESAAITAKVSSFFERQNVAVLNLQSVFNGRDPKTLVVNSLDFHPNESVHREVANLLTQRIRVGN